MKLLRAFLGVVLALSLGFAPAAAGPVVRPSPGFKSGFKFLGNPAPPAGATFIAGTTHTNVGSTDVYAFNCGGGCAVGDLMVIMGVTNGTAPILTLTGSGNTITKIDDQSNGSFGYAAYARVLTSGDISTGTITTSGGVTDYGTQVVIYRGAGTATSKVWNFSLGGTSLAFTGYAPAGGSLGSLMMTITYNNDGPTISASPGTWTTDVSASGFSTGTYFHAWALRNFVNYTNTTVTETTFGASGNPAGFLLELTP